MFTLQVTTTNNINLVTATLENITLADAIIIADRQADIAKGLLHPKTLELCGAVNVFISSSVLGGFVATFTDGEWEVDVNAAELALL